MDATAARPSVAIDGPPVIEEKYMTAASKAAQAAGTEQGAASAFTPEQVARFDAILDLEHQAQVTKNVAGFIVGDGRAVQRREQGRLFSVIEALSLEERTAFGEYRKTR